jgi:hypothetical protein
MNFVHSRDVKLVLQTLSIIGYANNITRLKQIIDVHTDFGTEYTSISSLSNLTDIQLQSLVDQYFRNTRNTIPVIHCSDVTYTKFIPFDDIERHMNQDISINVISAYDNQQYMIFDFKQISLGLFVCTAQNLHDGVFTLHQVETRHNCSDIISLYVDNIDYCYITSPI